MYHICFFYQEIKIIADLDCGYYGGEGKGREMAEIKHECYHEEDLKDIYTFLFKGNGGDPVKVRLAILEDFMSSVLKRFDRADRRQWAIIVLLASQTLAFIFFILSKVIF